MDAGGVVLCCNKLLCVEGCVGRVRRDSPEGAGCKRVGTTLIKRFGESGSAGPRVLVRFTKSGSRVPV